MQIGVRSAPVEVAFVAPEITPYSPQGPIGDACAALSKALRSVGHKVVVISPLWATIEPTARGLARRLSGVEVALGGQRHACSIFDGRTTGGVELVFVAQPELFGSLAGASPEAWLVFAEAVVQVLKAREPAVEVVHAHGAYAAAVLPLCEAALPRAARVLSLHDSTQRAPLSGLSKSVELPAAVRELAGSGADASLLCAGVRAAQRAVASSEHEAASLREGRGLDQALRAALAAEGKLRGIANGLDASRWNPLTDPLLPSRFDPVDLRGKARCKDGLQLELGLPVRPETPVVVCPLGEDGGAGALLARVAAPLLHNDVQLVVAGSPGEAEGALGALGEADPERMKVCAAADERLLHRAIAGADFVLLLEAEAARRELHLAAQRYGALPIARRAGAVADAVVDCDAELVTGSGFTCERESPEELLAAAQRALSAFAHDGFDALKRRVMRLDLSWERSARRYEYLYKELR